ncbi:MAG: glycoside hydrolase family 28 protein [Prevotella sp.]|jgi:polygalacturonase|nr:glycoside hydrolase family 28 protein [Prevotella sp.]
MKLSKFFIALGLVAASLTTQAASNNPYSIYTSNLPFSMPEISAPTFPNRLAILSDFGAVGNGTQLCTEAFEKAIESLSKQGGGRLVVPRGVWFTGPIVLRSNIDLHLEQGSIILFSGDMSLYPVTEVTYEGKTTRKCQSPISGHDLFNVAITGRGVIDGNGQNWRPLKRFKVTDKQWDKMTRDGGVMSKKQDLWYPSEEHIRLRPVLIHLNNCRNVLIQNVAIQNSPAWNIHPLMCENLIIDGVTARNPFYAQNGDALDLESCRNALVVNSTFDAGDDCICIKSGKDEEGRKRGRPCENVVVNGCTVFAGHGGFTVGSEMSGGVRNILVKDCQFLGTDVGIRFKSTRGRGGVVENIFINGISMYNIIEDALIFDMYYGGKSVTDEMDGIEQGSGKALLVPDETTPVFRNITIENIICRGASRALYFNGLPESPIKGITLRNINISADKEGLFSHCENIKKENVNILSTK